MVFLFIEHSLALLFLMKRSYDNYTMPTERRRRLQFQLPATTMAKIMIIIIMWLLQLQQIHSSQVSQSKSAYYYYYYYYLHARGTYKNTTKSRFILLDTQGGKEKKYKRRRDNQRCTRDFLFYSRIDLTLGGPRSTHTHARIRDRKNRFPPQRQ